MGDVTTVFETGKKKKAPRKRRGGRFLRVLKSAFYLLMILLLSSVVLGVGLSLVVVLDHRDILGRRYPALIENSYVYDAGGREVGEFSAEENRETVGPEGLGEHLPRAVVAVEDRRFYDHTGVDFEGVFRAAWADLKAREVRQGGSTITEQLMKNLYVPEEKRGDISFRRRFEQAALSYAYERGHSKEEILTAYLNTVYFGDGAYGAEVAARSYFGKSARDLTLSEAAALAGFLRAPSTYPKDGSGAEKATRRRDEVLELMREQGVISAAELREARRAPVEFSPEEPPDDPAYEPFVERVRREAEEELGPGSLRRGGLRLYTTLDPDLQRAAVESIDGVLGLPDDPSAAVVTVEPQSGAIRALAGQEEDFNLALDARRQPGSAFKPVVLATALREFASPGRVYVSRELTIRFKKQSFRIGNYDSIERGPITVAEAMAQSDNTVFVQLALDLGLRNVVQMAKDLGITTQVDPYPSTAIGGLGEGVSPLDMASAYATFAGGGVQREPYAIERTERATFGERETVYDHRITGRRVMNGNQAALETEVLRRVVTSGTASLFHNLDAEIGRPSAGKTGTTDDFVDAWYVGYTPRLSTAVWVGYPEGNRPMVDVHGLDEVNGENLPMDVWSSYMAQATSGDPPLDFPAVDYSEFSARERSSVAGG